MLTAFGRAFKTPDLRRKILFTLFIIAVYRLGAHVPTPGVSYPAVQQCIKGADNTISRVEVSTRRAASPPARSKEISPPSPG